jgi:hypothetical protein
MIKIKARKDAEWCLKHYGKLAPDDSKYKVCQQKSLKEWQKYSSTLVLG